MTKWVRVFGALALTFALAGTASADNPIVQATGVNLSWGDCGATGVQDKTFACGANTGSNVLWGSFIAPAGATNIVGASYIMDVINTGQSTLVDWWKFGAGNCRAAGAISTSYDFTTGTSAGAACVDFFQNAGFNLGAVQNLTENNKGPNTFRIKMAYGGLLTGVGLTAGDEEYAFKFQFSNANNVAPQTVCAGCSTPTCFVLNECKIESPDQGGNNYIISGAPASGRDFATWQGSAAVAGCATVPTRNRTWGQIKGMYR